MPTEAMVAEAVKAAISRGVKDIVKFKWRFINREKVLAYDCAYNKRRRAENPAQHRERLKRQYPSRTPEQKRYRQVRWIYGLSKQEYDELVFRQSNACAICFSTFDGRLPKDIHVDHDHVTEKVRGLLCGNCNRFIGIAKDSIERLNSAIEYLKRTSVV